MRAFVLVLVLQVIAVGGGYVGCFKDAETEDQPRDLPLWVHTGNDNTITKCIQLCTLKAYKYAGLQYAQECWCGDSYGKHGKVSDTECSMSCTGDQTQSCGSGRRNSVYTTGYLGCFRDTGTTRDLSVFSPNNQGRMTTATVEVCRSICKSKGEPYAGVQSYDQCYCGGTYGMFGERPKSECNTKCKGSAQMCGGTWRNSVYKTDILEGFGARA